MNVFQIALVFFIITNPLGNAPAIIALIKDYDIGRQQKILLRESLFSMLAAIFFLFLGESCLDCLNIQFYSLSIGGGILISLVALGMIFRAPINENESSKHLKHEPFLVPIATPIVAGPGLLTMIVLFSQQERNYFKLLIAILIAWSAITLVLWAAPYIQKLMGKRGFSALEQLMGMLLLMMATQMIVNGATLFLKTSSIG